MYKCKLFFALALFLFVLAEMFVLSGCTKKKEEAISNQNKNNTSDSPPKIIKGEVLTDIDGNSYNTIKIGNQIWMAENLKVTHFRNGDPIPHLSADTVWGTLSTQPAYCNYEDDPDNVETYGRLYNWFAVNDARKLAPENWHIPTQTEWEILINYLGGTAIAGGKLKESDTIHWDSPNIGATNITGFTALPGGERNNNGTYTNKGFSAGWWTTTGSDGDFATTVGLIFNSENATIDIDDMHYGYSIRCVHD